MPAIACLCSLFDRNSPAGNKLHDGGGISGSFGIESHRILDRVNSTGLKNSSGSHFLCGSLCLSRSFSFLCGSLCIVFFYDCLDFFLFLISSFLCGSLCLFFSLLSSFLNCLCFFLFLNFRICDSSRCGISGSLDSDLRSRCSCSGCIFIRRTGCDPDYDSNDCEYSETGACVLASSGFWFVFLFFLLFAISSSCWLQYCRFYNCECKQALFLSSHCLL